jgi:predicted N-formylglutamate amidohydrolase
MPPRFSALLLTCEHASNRVPAAYRAAFATDGERALLETHRGYDIGAAHVARVVHQHLKKQKSPPRLSDVLSGEVSRLLIDLNRSPRNPTLYSEFSQRLPDSALEQLMSRYYLPHQERVRRELQKLQQRRACVLHIGIHSFTPVLHGVTRNADVGILYDPRRPAEVAFAKAFRLGLRREPVTLRVRFNYPYRGIGDGLTSTLRKEHPDDRYAGIELELNQALLSSRPGGIARTVASAISTAIFAR